MSPALTKAALLIASDNGFLHRGVSQTAWLARVERRLRKEFIGPAIEEAEQFLAGLTDEQLDTICTGEESESKAVLVELLGNDHETLDLMLECVFDA